MHQTTWVGKVEGGLGRASCRRAGGDGWCFVRAVGCLGASFMWVATGEPLMLAYMHQTTWVGKVEEGLGRASCRLRERANNFRPPWWWMSPAVCPSHVRRSHPKFPGKYLRRRRRLSLSLALSLACALSRSRSLSLALSLARALSRLRSLSLALSLARALSRSRSLTRLSHLRPHAQVRLVRLAWE